MLGYHVNVIVMRNWVWRHKWIVDMSIMDKCEVMHVRNLLPSRLREVEVPVPSFLGGGYFDPVDGVALKDLSWA
jgi:hypothetical protein